MNIILVCGIDTNIGKTYIAGNILGQLLKNDRKVASFKPVQTGNTGFSEDLQNQLDIAKQFLNDHGLTKKINNYVGHTHLCSYILSEPVSPHFAAKIDQIDISIEKILDDLDTIVRQRYSFVKPSKLYSREKTSYVHLDTLLIELAGGIMSPVNDFFNNLDLIDLIKQYCQSKDINLKVVLVTCGKLGAISHTLSSIKLLPQLDYIVYNSYIAQSDDRIEQSINQDNFDYLKSLQEFCGIKKYIEDNTKEIHKSNYEREQYLTDCLAFVNSLSLKDKTYNLCQPSIVVENLLDTKIIKFSKNFDQDYFID